MPAIKPVGLGGDPASWPAGKASSLVKSLRADRPAPLSRAERIRRFGVDCGDGLVWQPTWVPGGEYTKTLTVKNVSKQAVTVKYKLPDSKFFSMAFPEKIMLNAGLSKTVEVSFRPQLLEPYDEVIEFTTDTGSFVVPIRAMIPTVACHVPTHLDFGFCPVNDVETRSFHVTNDGELPIEFSLSCEAPFTLKPTSGTVQPRQHASIEVTFIPKDASVFVAQCVCTVAGDRSHTIKIGGIGKYPFLTCSSERIDCGAVLTSNTLTKHFKLRNTSLVFARFELVRVDNDVEPSFVFHPTSGIIPPDGELDVGVQFRPKVTGTFTCDHYEVRTPGGNTVPIECSGEAVGPELVLSKEVINFNDVIIQLPRQSSSRIFEIHNKSEIPVPFQLHSIEPNGLFTLEPAHGVVPPNLSAHVTFTFSPPEPGNYYRRVYVLFHNAAPKAVDLIGSGYTEKRRPMPIAPRFVAEYLHRELRNQHRLTPDELQAKADLRRMAMASGAVADDDGELFDPTVSEMSTMVTDPRSEVALMRGLFRGACWRQGAVYFEEDRVAFGEGSRIKISEARTVRLVNRTNGKLTVQWVVPNGYVNGGPKDLKAAVFAVTPAQCDVGPNSTAEFAVQFRPQSDQQYYVQSLECYCSFKSMRTFRLVTEDSFALPWCLSLTASGYTFAAGAEQFIPRGILSHSLLTFPAVHCGDASFQTISIRNDNDTPMLFEVSDLASSFAILPAVGVVPAGETQLLAVRFQPADARRYRTTAMLTLNNDGGAAIPLQLVGTGCKAALTMPSKLFMPTACVGAASHAKLTLTNPSRLPLAYEWDIPEKLVGLLTVDCPAGVLRGRESIELDWRFAPNADRTYLAKVPCLVSPLDDGVDGGNHEIVKQILHVSGVGSSGVIQADPPVVDFKTVLVGNSHRRTLTLINSSPVDLWYSLSFTREGDPALHVSGLRADELIHCEQNEGLVPARNTMDVKLVLKPPRRETFEFSVRCTLRPGKSAGLGNSTRTAGGVPLSPEPPEHHPSLPLGLGELLGPPRELCRVTAMADFPQLQVCDVRLAGVSQEILWQQLRVPELNAELRSILSEAELKVMSSEGASSMGDIASLQATLPVVDMMMPPALPGDPTMTLHLLVRNVGELGASFRLRYPTEMELQIEHWADKGEPTARELKQHLIVDKGVLAVSPKMAELAPGEDVELLVKMRHFRADDYELPVLLQITSGRQLTLNIKGRTLALGEKYLHIPLREVVLPPTPIGLQTPQRHTFELPNYSDVPLPFEVQLQQVYNLNASNFNFPILVCENPSGIIPPGGVAHVAFRFNPLEVKDYHVALPVALGAAGTRTFVLLASGYHPREPTEYEAFLSRQRELMPPAQQLIPERQPMRLSFDRALFGQVPQGATLRKLLVLRNVHSMPCDFAWDTTHPLWGTILSIYPSSGTVGAGKHLCCKLSLNGIGPPEELRTHLTCMLSPHIDPNALTETERLAAANAFATGTLGLLPATHPLAAGTALRPRSDSRIPVTELQPKLRGLQALIHIEERESRRQAAAAGMTAQEYAMTAAASQVQQVTLPPSQAGDLGPAPPPPPPQLLLDVRACISPTEVLAAGGVDMTRFYLPRALQPTEFPPPPSAGTATSSPRTLPPVQAEQRETVEVLVAMMLDEVLNDNTIRRTINSVDVEPTPWFRQITESRLPGAAAAAAAVAAAEEDAAEDAAAAASRRQSRRPSTEVVNAPTAQGVAAVAGATDPGFGAAVPPPAAPASVEDVDIADQTLEAQIEAADRLARAQRRAAEVERRRREAETSARVRGGAEFQELVAYVLEGTLFNLVSEVSLGEFPLDTVPRQIVRSVEIAPEGP